MSFETEPLLTQKVDHENKKKKKERERERGLFQHKLLKRLLLPNSFKSQPT